MKRFVLPALAIIACGFMVFAACYAHGYTPYMNAQAEGSFKCPVLFYLVVYIVVMVVGAFFKGKKSKQ